jgi:hypothetical protein
MLSLYIVSLIAGGGLLLVSLFGDIVDHGDTVDHGHHGDAFHILSLRTATYFAFGFGGVGAALSWAWDGNRSLLAAGLALLTGVGLAALVDLTFRYLRRTESGDRSGDTSFIGLSGRISIPLSHRRTGKVVVLRGERTVELLARPYEPGAEGPENWKAVVVVEMDGGTALVAPLDDKLLTPG